MNERAYPLHPLLTLQDGITRESRAREGRMEVRLIEIRLSGRAATIGK